MVAGFMAWNRTGKIRKVAENMLAGRANFTSVSGRAEATNLPDDSVDLVTAGQTFHWFDWPRSREEFLRILRDDDYEPALAALQAAFKAHAKNDQVHFLYTTHVHTGWLAQVNSG